MPYLPRNWRYFLPFEFLFLFNFNLTSFQLKEVMGMVVLLTIIWKICSFMLIFISGNSAICKMKKKKKKKKWNGRVGYFLTALYYKSCGFAFSTTFLGIILCTFLEFGDNLVGNETPLLQYFEFKCLPLIFFFWCVLFFFEPGSITRSMVKYGLFYCSERLWWSSLVNACKKV